jgi:hypothetical protein
MFVTNTHLIILLVLPEYLYKGGVPATPSGTATLLRLSPSHWFYPNEVCYLPLQVYPTPMA